MKSELEIKENGEGLDFKSTTESKEKRLFIETYGCQMNVADSEVVASVMQMDGYTVTDKLEDADAVFVNTCSIRDNAEQRVVQRLDYFNAIRKKKKPNLIIGVLGCMAERVKEELHAKHHVDVVVGPDAYMDLPNLVGAAESGEKAINVQLSKTETYKDVIPLRIGGNHISGFISIMRGCDKVCSYCIVPYTRGRERSRIPQSILNEVADLRDKGFKEVTLLGQNVSTKKQSLKMQIEELKKFSCTQIVQEKVSALADRPQFDTLLSTLKQGDTLAVWKLDRLGRSMFDLIKIVSEMDAKGIKFVSLTENIDTSTSTGKMMLMLFSMMAEYELEIKKERQEATKEIARKSGRLGGRPKGLSREAKKTAAVLMGNYQEQENGKYKYSISELCAAHNISKGTLYKYLEYMNVPKRGNLF